jgi:hypothetical protein
MTNKQHLAEIEARNALRRENGLPELSVARELRRMKQQAAEAEFKAFEAVHGRVVFDQVLKERREVFGANWKPNFMTGMAMQNQVRKILRSMQAEIRSEISWNT